MGWHRRGTPSAHDGFMRDAGAVADLTARGRLAVAAVLLSSCTAVSQFHVTPEAWRRLQSLPHVGRTAIAARTDDGSTVYVDTANVVEHGVNADGTEVWLKTEQPSGTPPIATGTVLAVLGVGLLGFGIHLANPCPTNSAADLLCFPDYIVAASGGSLAVTGAALLGVGFSQRSRSQVAAEQDGWRYVEADGRIPGEAPAAPAEPIVAAALSRLLATARTEVLACFALGDGGGEPGTVVVDADGRISDVRFLRSSDDTHVRQCLRSLVTSAPAIAPAPGKEVRLFHVFTRDP